MTDYTPSDAQVAISWLKSCPTLAGVSVATTLAANTSWGGPTFLQVTESPLGLPPHPNYPSHNPRIIVNCWGKVKRWADAADIAQLVRAETYRISSARIIHINGYVDVRVMSVQTLSEPLRITGDPNELPRYSLALGFEWCPVEAPILQ